MKYYHDYYDYPIREALLPPRNGQEPFWRKTHLAHLALEVSTLNNKLGSRTMVFKNEDRVFHFVCEWTHEVNDDLAAEHERIVNGISSCTINLPS